MSQANLTVSDRAYIFLVATLIIAQLQDGFSKVFTALILVLVFVNIFYPLWASEEKNG